MNPPTRRMQGYARIVLAWYLLFVGVCVLAAVIQPRSIEVVCSAMSVMKLVVQGDDSQAPTNTAMDCPLCAHTTPAMPAPSINPVLQISSPLAHALEPIIEALMVSLTAPPLSSRGPPHLS